LRVFLSSFVAFSLFSPFFSSFVSLFFISAQQRWIRRSFVLAVVGFVRFPMDRDRDRPDPISAPALQRLRAAALRTAVLFFSTLRLPPSSSLARVCRRRRRRRLFHNKREPNNFSITLSHAPSFLSVSRRFLNKN